MKKYIILILASICINTSHAAAEKDVWVSVDNCLTPRQIAIATALQSYIPTPEIINLISHYEKPEWKEHSIDTKRSGFSMAIEGNGEYIITNTKNDIIILLCPETGNILREIPVKSCLTATSIDISPDSNLLAVSTFGLNKIKIVDIDTDALVLKLDHGTTVDQIKFLPQNNRLISVNGRERTMKSWDTETGKCILDMPFPLRGRFTVTLDGQLLATALSAPEFGNELERNKWKSVKIWDAATFKLIRTLKDIILGVTCMTFSPDNTQLAMASFVKESQLKKEYYPICIMNPYTGKQIHKLEQYTPRVSSMAYSSTGLLATGANDGTILLWNPLSGQPITQLENYNRAIDFLGFSPNGKYILSKAENDCTIRISKVPPISIEEKKERKENSCLIS